MSNKNQEIKKKPRKKKKKVSDKKAKSAYDKLSEKHKQFFLEYIASRNAVKSYMKTYSSSNYNAAGVNGHKLLKNTKIKAALKEYYDNLWENKEDQIAPLFDKLLKMANADIAEVVNYKDGKLKIKDFKDIKDTSIIKKISQNISQTKYGTNVHNSIEIIDPQKAQSDLERVLGMIKDKMEFDGTIEVVPASRPEDENDNQDNTE
jgi:phage terminase small subunit